MAATELPLADELAELAARMSPMARGEKSARQGVSVLTSLARETIPGAVGAGITLVDLRGRRTSTAATDEVVRRADDLQYDLGEGPCLDAYAARSTVELADVAAEHRWPRWVEAVRPLGLASSLSVALVVGEACLGAVKVYGDRAHAFDDRSVRLLQGYAEAAALLLANATSAGSSHGVSESLRQALHARDAVQVAKGVLMQSDGLSEDAAFQVLVGRARTGNRVLLEVAQETIRTAGGPGSEPSMPISPS